MKLDQLKALNDKISIYIPSEYQQDSIETSKLLASLFGGSTVNKVDGNWIMKDETLCSEKIDIIYSYCDQLSDDTINEIVKHAEKLKTECNQESILIEINNKGYLV